jgi:speckle-type POZ protein
MPHTEIKYAKVSIARKSFHFNVKNFKDLPTTRDHFVRTPAFSYNGHEWDVVIYPGGSNGDGGAGATDGWVSIYLQHRSQCSEGSITLNFQLKIIDKFGKNKKVCEDAWTIEGQHSHRFYNYIRRSAILNEHQNILDSDGTLRVAVSMKEEPSDVFVPNNPLHKMMQGIFLDEGTADICFEVCSAEAKGEQKRVKASELFHAHHLILKACAPMLADLFDLEDSDGKIATATITDVKPDIFRHLLWYVYGGSVPEEDLKAHAKAIIDAADKYSIVNLKLKAEAAFVKSTDITMDNAMDNLLYADAKNCALLEEAVIDFLVENSAEAVEKISFKDVPGHLMKDLLVVISRDWKKDATGTAAVDELSTLRVSALRRKLAEKGLDVDGSREAMIESIKNNSTESDDDNNNGDGDGDDDENAAGDGGGDDEDD